MERSAFPPLLVSVLLVCAPALEGATGGVAGKVISDGTVEVNGTLVPGGTTVFLGDHVVTRQKAIILALSDGHQVFLPQNTSTRLDRTGLAGTILLERGALAVVQRGSDPLLVMANGVRVQAAGENPAVYEVAVNGKTLQVLARKGAVLVSAADRTIELKEGNALDAMVGAAPQGPAGAGATALSTLEKVVIGVGVAAGMTGLALGVAALTRPNPKECSVVSSTSVIRCP